MSKRALDHSNNDNVDLDPCETPGLNTACATCSTQLQPSLSPPKLIRSHYYGNEVVNMSPNDKVFLPDMKRSSPLPPPLLPDLKSTDDNNGSYSPVADRVCFRPSKKPRETFWQPKTHGPSSAV